MFYGKRKEWFGLKWIIKTGTRGESLKNLFFYLAPSINIFGSYIRACDAIVTYFLHNDACFWLDRATKLLLEEMGSRVEREDDKQTAMVWIILWPVLRIQLQYMGSVLKYMRYQGAPFQHLWCELQCQFPTFSAELEQPKSLKSLWKAFRSVETVTAAY